MAKKKNVKKTKKAVQTPKATALPQNVVFLGEHVEENKNIYILQSVYKKIQNFTANKTVNESGGVLIGHTVEELGKTNIFIEGFIEGKYCEGTPTTLTFTHQTWDHIHKEMKKYPKDKIVGWIHTHPNFGIFLSEYDKFIHENFFSEDYQVAYVVDPIQKIEGFYFWINGKVERCKGFYVYDRAGAKISVEKEEKYVDSTQGFSLSNVLTYLLVVVVVFLVFLNLSQNKEIQKLKDRISILENNVNVIINDIYQPTAPSVDNVVEENKNE